MHITRNYGSIIYRQTKGRSLDSLKYLTESIKLNSNSSNYGLIFNFKPSERKIEIQRIEITQANKDKISQEYLWVGNTPDVSNRFITTNSIDRYISPDLKKNTIYLLSNNLSDGKLKSSLKEIIEIFFPENNQYMIELNTLSDFPSYIRNSLSIIENYRKSSNKEEEKQNSKYLISVLPFLSSKDLPFFEKNIFSESDLEKFLEEKCPSKPNEKAKYITKILSSIIGIDIEKEVVLLSSQIDGNLISRNEEYIEFLFSEKFDQSNAKKVKTKNLICSLCGQNPAISTDYLKKSKIKFFMTNKDIFTAGLAKNFENNFNLCYQCFKELILGEKFLLSSLKVFWAGRNMLIIPEITPISDLEPGDLKNIEEKTRLIHDQMYKFEEHRNIQKELEDLQEIIGFHSLVYHYVFFTTDNGGRPNKIIKIIRDVPPTRLKKIMNVIEEIAGDTQIRNEKIKGIDLLSIYYSIPVRIDKKKKPKGKSYVYTIYDAIFSQKKLDHHQIIENFQRSIHHLYYNTQGYNLTDNKSGYAIIFNVIDKTLIMNTILEFLEKINSLSIIQKKPKPLINMTEKDKPQIQEEIDNYWANKSVYNKNEARALFLMGILLADAGSAQYEKLNSEPILKKVQFNGMKLDRIIQLLNEIVDKLIKYKKYHFDSSIHAGVQEYIDRVNPSDWELTPSENVFYLMSGYAFKRAFLRKLGKFTTTSSADNTSENTE